MSRHFRASKILRPILGLRSLRRLPQALVSGPVGAITCVYKTSPPTGDSRIAGLTEDTVTFRWKDRANGGTPRTATLPGVEFVRRYLQHVLPRGMKAIRYYGFCHPAAKAKREHIASATGCAPCPAPGEKPAAPARPCPCCGQAMVRLCALQPAWHRASVNRNRLSNPPGPVRAFSGQWLKLAG